MLKKADIARGFKKGVKGTKYFLSRGLPLSLYVSNSMKAPWELKGKFLHLETAIQEVKGKYRTKHTAIIEFPGSLKFQSNSQSAYKVKWETGTKVWGTGPSSLHFEQETLLQEMVRIYGDPKRKYRGAQRRGGIAKLRRSPMPRITPKTPRLRR